MNFVVGILVALTALGYGWTAFAYYDDSIVIEIEDGSPPTPEPTTTDSTSQGGSTGDSSGTTGSTSSSGGTSGSGSGTSSGGTSGGTSSGGSSGSGSSSSSSGGGSAGGQSSEDTAFNTLVESGAVVGTGSSGAGTSGASTSDSDGVQGSNSTSASGSANSGPSSSGGFSSITLSASAVRKTVSDDLSLRQALDNILASATRGGRVGFSQRQVGLIAASTIVNDQNIDEIVLGTSSFGVRYRSQGYLLGFIPKKFPVQVNVRPEASVASERVAITLPWYRFLLRKLFNPDSVNASIQKLIEAAQSQVSASAIDVQAALVGSVTDLLKKEFGTIGGSVQKQ